ncbi:hypothetical protein P3L10_001065 [Capsicum annuum]
MLSAFKKDCRNSLLLIPTNKLTHSPYGKKFLLKKKARSSSHSFNNIQSSVSDVLEYPSTMGCRKC